MDEIHTNVREDVEALFDTIIYNPDDREENIATYEEKVLKEILDKNWIDTPKNSNFLACCALKVIPRIQHRSSLRYFLSFVRSIIQKSSRFRRSIADELIGKTDTFATSFPSVHTCVISLLTTIIEEDLGALDAKTDVKDLIQSLCSLFEASFQDSKRLKNTDERIILKLLKAHHTVFNAFLEAISLSADKSKILYNCISSLQKISLAKEDSLLKTVLIKVYPLCAFENKQRPSLKHLDCFASFISSITSDEFQASIYPLLSRMMKKSPDSIIEAVSHMIHHLTIDMTKYTEEIFIPVFISKLRSQNSDVRKSCIELVGRLATKILDVDIILRIVSEMKGLLEGKHGILAQYYQRQAIYLSLISLLNIKESIGSSETKTVGLSIIEILNKAIDKEANEESAMMALFGLGKWLNLVGQISSTVASTLHKCLKDTSVTKGSAAYCLYLACIDGKDDMYNSMVEFKDDMVKLVLQSEQKPTLSHPEGLLSIAILSKIAKINQEVNKHFESNSISSLMNSTTSFFYTSLHHSLTSSKSMESYMPEFGAQISFSQSLKEYLGEKENSDHPLSRTQSLFMVQLMCHSSKEIRTIVLKDASAIVTSNPFSSKPLLNCLREYVGKSCTTPSSQLYDALRASIPMNLENEIVRRDIFPLVLILSHHPLVTGTEDAKKCKRFWSSVSLKLLGPHVTKLSSEEVDSKIDQLFEIEGVRHSIYKMLTSSSGGIYDEFSGDVMAAVNCVSSMLEYTGNGSSEAIILEDFIPHLACAIQSEQVTGITPDHLAIYYTPEGTLYDPKNILSESKQINKGRASKEELWEHEVRKDLQKKSKDMGKMSDEEQAMLNKQEEIRKQVGSTKKSVASTLKVISLLTSRNPDEMHSALPILLPAVRKLLLSTLFTNDATDCLLNLGQCVTPTMRKLSYSMATCVRICTLAGDELVQYEKTISLLLKDLATLTVDSMDPEPIPPPTYHFIFPILKAILLSNKPINGHENALAIFGANAKMISIEEEMDVGDIDTQRLLRKEMIEVVLHVLASAPKATPHPDEVLAWIVSGPSLSIPEWAPLIGNEGLLSSHLHVRQACVEALSRSIHDDSQLNTSSNPLLGSRLWYITFDEVHEIELEAKHLWEQSSSHVARNYIEPLLLLLDHSQTHVRTCGSKAIAGLIKHFDDIRSDVVNTLMNKYSNSMPKVEADEFGIPDVRRNKEDEVEKPSTWIPRCGVAEAIQVIALFEAVSVKQVNDILPFVVEKGLCDLFYGVREQMVKAGAEIVNMYGSKMISTMLPTFEAVLDKPQPTSGKRRDLDAYDHQREGIVVCLGCLAKHMDKSDPKVSSIVKRLIESLSIPSESVQRAVANCLCPLIASVKNESNDIIDGLLNQAINGEQFGDRLGAAFGLAAVVKGLGISSLKQNNIISRLEEAMRSNTPQNRQGSLFVFECLSERLGFLFEPYVIVILPVLLKSFADNSQHVRDAAEATSKAIMAKLSGHGVKLVLPSLLKALEDDAWRTKQAAIQLLGAMAYCAPKQLGSCLPQIVPKMTEALGDSHPKVRVAGKKALHDIASVIRNPEVAKVSEILLSALEDPNKQTLIALQVLKATVYVHSIDAPSLALITPIIHRGLREINADSKKIGSMIVANMCSMISDPKDIAPYIDILMPDLRRNLMDPIPEVRQIVAKALGMLVKGMGEEYFPDLVQWLCAALKSEASSVERSGGAQGLCEVMVTLGERRLEDTIDELLELADHPKFYVREGIMWMTTFLPQALGKNFVPFISRILPIIISGLSDEVESIREVSMRAGQVLVNGYGAMQVNEILPSLEIGLFHDNWRIRQSSVSLLGDLMYRISGSKAVGVAEADDEDEAAGSAATDTAIIKVVGKEKRNSILASLYIIRSDTSTVVRQSALQVWKSIVSNTPRTLREILETLMNMVVDALSSSNNDKRVVAGRALGEIVKKLGERVMPEVIPILRAGLNPNNSQGMRQGVCLGLAEVISCASKNQIEDYVDTLVEAVQEALCDELETVRKAASQAFQMLTKNIGSKAVNEIIPPLLKQIESGNEERSRRAVLGLQGILGVRSRDILTYLIPKLLSKPLSISHMTTLAAVAEVSTGNLHYYVESIISVLFEEFTSAEAQLNDDLCTAIKITLRMVALAITDDGVQWFASDVSKYCDSEKEGIKYISCWIIGEFCRDSTCDYSLQTPLFLKDLISRLTDSSEKVLSVSLDALRGITKNRNVEELSKHLDFIRNTMNSMISDARHRKGGVGGKEYLLPAFHLPKCLDPFLPIFQHSLMNGGSEVRESAALGLGELVSFTESKALAPFLIKITGPLIRIAGDRFPPRVKLAILDTLCILLRKGGVALKPFIPQLQTTFVKTLSDPSATVRSKASEALGKLMGLSTRIEPVVAELCDKIKTSENEIQASIIEALVAVLECVGQKVTPSLLHQIATTCQPIFSTEEDAIRIISGKCFSLVLNLLPSEEAKILFEDLSSPIGKEEDWKYTHGRLLAVQGCLQRNPEWMSGFSDGIWQRICNLSENKSAFIRQSSLACMGYLILSGSPEEYINKIIPTLTISVDDINKDTCCSAIKVIKVIAKKNPEITRGKLSVFIPPLLKHAKGTNITVKLAAERCLLYLLGINSRPETLAECLRVVDSDTSKMLSDYCRRFLSKLKDDSGDEL